ncbi:MAG: cobalt transporter [Candidatus Saccharibacteria bacterium]
MERKYLIASVAILAVFAIGLIGFFLASNGLPDGLDKTMEQNGVTEKDPVYQAPLTYGDGFVPMLIMGGVGFIVTLLAVLGVMKLRKAAKSP